MNDYVCSACDHLFEALARDGDPVPCEKCQSTQTSKRATGGHLFTVIKATTTTSKKYKAGYVHKFQNRPAEKISVQVPAAPKTS